MAEEVEPCLEIFSAIVALFDHCDMQPLCVQIQAGALGKCFLAQSASKSLLSSVTDIVFV